MPAGPHRSRIPRQPPRWRMQRSFLAIYLRDHHAAGVAGTRLARRAAQAQTATSDLPAVASEIEQDLSALEGIMRSLGVERDRGKDALARIGERLGRLNPTDGFESASTQRRPGPRSPCRRHHRQESALAEPSCRIVRSDGGSRASGRASRESAQGCGGGTAACRSTSLRFWPRAMRSSASPRREQCAVVGAHASLRTSQGCSGMRSVSFLGRHARPGRRRHHLLSLPPTRGG